MQHTETVESRTLSLLKKLKVMPSLKLFALVGGTALSLRYGHRSSIDIDGKDRALIYIGRNSCWREFFVLYLCEIFSGRLKVFFFLMSDPFHIWPAVWI